MAGRRRPTGAGWLALAVLLVAAAGPGPARASSCSDGVASLHNNASFVALQRGYFQSFTLVSRTETSATLAEDAREAATFEAACLSVGADFCSQGGDTSAAYTTNTTGTPYSIVGAVSLCFPNACCETEVCGLPDDFKPWLEDDLEAMLHALCEKYPSICPRSFADADLNLAEGCRVYNTLEVVLLIGIVVGSGLLACACMVALCRALLSCWRGNRYHVQLRDDGDRLARARQRLLDNHVRAYDPEKDRRHETCAICLDGWESGQEVHSFSPCNHLFHAKCIADWLRHRDTCPICRASWKEPTTV